MEPITLILAALSTGATVGGQAIASDAIKDTYGGLRELIKRKFAGKPSAELALTEHETDQKTWEAPLKKALTQEQLDQDPEIIEAAQKIMSLIQPQQAAMGKYNVQITGNVQGFAQGDYQHVNMNFGSESTEE